MITHTIYSGTKYPVEFGGHVEKQERNGFEYSVWKSDEHVIAQAYDIPIPGYK